MAGRVRAACDSIWNAPGISGRILVCALLVFSSPAAAETLVEVLAEAERQELASDPTWRRLLRFEEDAERSSLLAEEFFLAENGREDPHAEMVATLRAYYEEGLSGGDESPRCRFPARYHWLSSKLALEGYRLRNSECEKLENWALFDQTESVSLLLVSGYLGNPASTFGHSLLKLNSGAADDRAGLFDLTLNFGALIPENENPILYIARGLTGGYEAGFSDRFYYTQDLVYTRREFRDMWEYRLNLPEFERTLLILHLWEIVGRKFQYYFLDKNCGYRIAEMLQLALEDDDVVDGPGAWYPPVGLFHRISDLERRRADRGLPPIVESVSYIPSSRRRLHHELRLLDEAEMDAVNVYVHGGSGELSALIAGFPEERQTILLDGLLAYQQYRLAVDQPDSTDEAWQRKREILVARLQLPARERVEVVIPELRSPATGFRPAEIALTGSVEDEDFRFASINWSPFKKESVGRNSLEGDELAFLDFSLGFADDSPALFVDRFDAIRILSLNPPWTRIRGERGISWKLRVGVDRVHAGGEHDYDGVFSFGAGRAWSLGSRVLPFALLNAEAHSDSPHFRLSPELGVIAGASRLRGRVSYAAQSADYEGDFENRWSAKLMLGLNSRHSLHAEWTDGRTSRGSLGISRYF